MLRVVFAGYVALIVLLSVAPSAPGVSSDKLAHFGAYAILGLLGMPLTATARGRVSMLVSLVTMGAGLEVIQALIPTRSASGLDLVADAIGVSVGALFWLVGARTRKRVNASLSSSSSER